MDYSTLFIDSLELHQKLVNILVKARDESGFSTISQPEIAEQIGRSQTWVSSAIKRLNTEDICIEQIASGKYKLHYEDLQTHGVFSKILFLAGLTYHVDQSIFFKKDREIAEEFGVNLKTVQMYKSYFRTGWKILDRQQQAFGEK